MIEKSQICVVIPAHNEEKNIKVVCEKIISLGYLVCVVDDGSRDSTPQILSSLPVHCIHLNPNRGKGFALRTGLEWADNENFQAVVLMDADGQHEPQEIDLFLKTLNESSADFVIGNRMAQHTSMPWVRVWTNFAMSFIISSSAGQKISDCTCGFRALRTPAFKKMNLRTNRYEIESEMILEAARLKIKIESVPISCTYGNEVSQIRPVRDTLRFFRFLFGYSIKRRVGK